MQKRTKQQIVRMMDTREDALRKLLREHGPKLTQPAEKRAEKLTAELRELARQWADS
jgi:hypothetical protein